MVVEALRRVVHGARLLAHAGVLVVGPQRAAEELDAADDDAVALEQMDVGVPGRLRASGGQLGMAVTTVEFVIAAHVDHRLGVETVAAMKRTPSAMPWQMSPAMT